MAVGLPAEVDVSGHGPSDLTESESFAGFPDDVPARVVISRGAEVLLEGANLQLRVEGISKRSRCKHVAREVELRISQIFNTDPSDGTEQNDYGSGNGVMRGAL